MKKLTMGTTLAAVLFAFGSTASAQTQFNNPGYGTANSAKFKSHRYCNVSQNGWDCTKRNAAKARRLQPMQRRRFGY